MTEFEARQLILLQAHEDSGLTHGRPATADDAALWTAEDRAWATRQALGATGEAVSPERFALARAAIGLQRLLPRSAAAQHWLQLRWWRLSWVGLAALLGLLAGLLVDQLGPPTRVALLAPSVWLVVGWNLGVYAALVLPWNGVRRWLAEWVAEREQQRSAPRPASLWARHAAPLTLARVSCVLHAASASLGLGVIASLYVRGLVLDYRIGWKSTFLSAAQLQQLLGWLLAPALLVGGQLLPDVAPLRLGPGQAASASAAPWIHLFATTVLLLVVLPRLLLAAWAGWRARWLRLNFPVPLDTPYFQGLHTLMRPGQDHRLRLLCVALPGVQPPALLGRPWAQLQPWPLGPATALGGPAWLSSDAGDELWLHGPPEGWQVDGPVQDSADPHRWFDWRWLGRGRAVAGPAQAQALLRQSVHAVLLVGPPGTVPTPALQALGRPVLVLEDSPQPDAPHLPLRALDEAGVPDWRWLNALDQCLDHDPRLQGLLASWQRRHQALRTAVARTLAAALAGWASQREPLAEGGLFSLGSKPEQLAAAQQPLTQALHTAWAGLCLRLAELPEQQGLPPPWVPDGRAAAEGARAASPALQPDPSGHAVAVAPPLPEGLALGAQAPAAHQRVKAGTSAVLGGVLSGALTGLGADLMSGGLTLGMGALVGAAAGALGGAGAAQGANLVRGTGRSFVRWPDPALSSLAQAAVAQALASSWARPGAAPVAPPTEALQAVWAQRSTRAPTADESARLAAALTPVLEAWLHEALAAPPAVR